MPSYRISFWAILSHRNIPKTFTKGGICWSFFLCKKSCQKGCTALCTIFMILLTLWNSEQKNGLLIKLFVFHSILLKFGKIVVHNAWVTTTSPSFIKIRWKKKVLLIARFSVQNFKVSVESWKSYIVLPVIFTI